MLIEITQEDINKAKETRKQFDDRKTWYYCRAETCPLAFALKRVFPASRIAVMPWGIYVDRKEIFRHNDITKSFIENTDKKKDRIRPQKLEVPIND